MNNHHNRGAKADDKREPDRAEAIRFACHHLANTADAASTSATLFLSDGARSTRPPTKCAHCLGAGAEGRPGMITTRTTRVRGFASWRPRRATVELLDQVHTVLAEYREYLPLTVRQIFYRLVGAHGYDKTEAAYARLGEHLNRARRAGLIAFDAIRDDGITLTEPSEWDSAEQLVRTCIAESAAVPARRPAAQAQPRRLIFAVEAAGMLPQVQRIADPHGIAVHSSGGASTA